ncbi:MAG TPA: glycosyltransferase family 9 protein [Tepidisphaeraceae bacterium]|nr:glycosyltransferase family 9 protein [Tepidisphaeraceae bacterium]
MPALWAVRRHFPGAHISLLCNVQVGKSYVLASDLLRGSGAVDDFVLYPVPGTLIGRILRPVKMLRLALRLRAAGYDSAVYLPPSGRSMKQIARDRLFFKLAGVKKLVGMDVPMSLPAKGVTRPLPTLPREMDLLLSRLNAAGLPAQPASLDTVSLGVGPAEHAEVARWLSSLPPDAGKTWVGIAPGSKMPAKRWPVERYRDVVKKLIEHHDIWPVIFGGTEDHADGQNLLAAWGRGYNAAGSLGLRASAAAIARCQLYIGNDTGTMHLAASTGVRCVAVFCSRNFPGLWDPFGQGHIIFRTSIDCEGCMLESCIQRRMECILSITESDVFQACAGILSGNTPLPSPTLQLTRPS